MLKQTLMKILTSFICLLLISSMAIGQSQSITVVHMKNGSAIIECKKVIDGGGIFENRETDNGKYWISTQTNNLLQAGLKKAITWAKLNEEHQKEFEKEIIRIRVTEKETYEFYRRYIPEFSKEAKLIFEGHTDGTFTLSLTVTDDVVTITIATTEGVNNLIKLLQGKSVNSDIDEIFH